MAYHILDEGHLYMGRIVYVYFRSSLAVVQRYGFVSKYGETYLPFVANDFNAVCTRTFVADKTP